jgi:ankyrin repeat protein
MEAKHKQYKLKTLKERREFNQLFITGKRDIVAYASAGNIEAVKCIVGVADVPLTTVDDAGRTPMIAACENQQWSIAEYLLSRRDVEKWIFLADKNGRTALYWAEHFRNDNIRVKIETVVVNRVAKIINDLKQ